MPNVQPSILGISFDGLHISGIVNEFLNVAAALRGNKFRVLFDLGFDITMGRTVDSGHLFLPQWVELIRSLGPLPEDYCREVVEEAYERVIAGTSIAAEKTYDDLCSRLAGSIVETFSRENVHLLVIENATLPDNPLFTEALYRAIIEYGAQLKIGKYVLWRDHDLMWSVQPHLYGQYPYSGVRKPDVNPYIHYSVATKWMLTRMQAWAPSVHFHIISNCFSGPVLPRPERPSLRAAYSIPDDAYLIARCTRVIREKSIERDLLLLKKLQERLAQGGNHRKVFLFVTGPTAEDKAQYRRLRALARSLALEEQVVWGDGLLPFNRPTADLSAESHPFSIYDLLIEADLSSFLTSYDYEGFGNPPGEAMAAGVPFISTTYELYHDVYGSKGVVAPLLHIDRNSSPKEPIPEDFILWTLRLLTDKEYREHVVKRNLDICRRFFSTEVMTSKLREMFPASFLDQKG